MERGAMLLISLSAGISVCCLILAAIPYLTRVKLEKNEVTQSAKLPLFFRLFRLFLPLAMPLARNGVFAALRNAAAPKILMAGAGDILTPEQFTAYRIVFCTAAMAVLFLGSCSEHFLICVVLAVLLVIYPSAWISATIKKRHLEIMKALPNVLDLLTLSVEAGRDLLSALRDILSRRRRDALGEELIAAFQEIQLGRKRSEALRALANRVGLPELTSTLNAIIQAEELGVSIAQQLRIQGDMQRNKRFTRAEKMANEASVKIIIPIVIFILPAVFIILMVPLIMQAMKAFS